MEIKCPYCSRESIIEGAAKDNKFCLKNIYDNLYLDYSHAYYYQVQIQLFVANVDWRLLCMYFFTEPRD